jgi:signal transduction histidine kinase
MTDITFSRRLAGVTATIIYVALVIGFAPSIIRNHQLNGTPAGTGWMTLGVIVYGLAVTLGWQTCMRRQNPAWVRAYFVALPLLLLGLFVLEIVDVGGGSVGNLLVVVLLQGGVLTLWAQIGLHLVSVAAMTLIAAATMPVERVVLPFLVLLLTNGAVTLMGYLIVRDEKTQIALEAANRQLRDYAAQADDLATMRERNRLAREIHDSLGHYLTIVNTQIEAARAIMPTDPERGAYLLERAQALTKEGLSEIRRSVSALRAEQRPLPDAIRALIAEHESSGLSIGYEVEGAARPCSPPVEQALYRAAQEGLTNVRRHAHATRADVQLCYTPERVTLCIHDNGVGSADGAAGFGLIGLRERLNPLNGVVHTESAQGFTLRVEVPA